MEKEQDQAMSAYFKASQMMMGCHLPQLYIKLEYSLTNNTHLAEKFFSQALEVALNDTPQAWCDGPHSTALLTTRGQRISRVTPC